MKSKILIDQVEKRVVIKNGKERFGGLLEKPLKPTQAGNGAVRVSAEALNKVKVVFRTANDLTKVDLLCTIFQ
jgi:hypothetical protein